MNLGSLFAQDDTAVRLPLPKILELIEQRYSISFSYVDDVVSEITIPEPDSLLSFREIMGFLRKNTDLNFEVLDNRFIVITSKSRANFQSILSLDEVVITNYLTSGISKSFTNTITVEPKKFGILPGLLEPDVLQTIQALPGIISVDELVSNINIRGGTHDENLILWDGIKMYQSGHFFGMISAFNPYLTKSVNISKNGTSVKYGDGVSGIIDIRNSNRLSQNFSAGLGANFISVDGFAKVPLSKKSELQVAARKSLTDFIETPTYNQYFKRIFEDANSNINANNNQTTEDKFNFYDLSAKFLYDVSSTDKLRVNFISIFNDLKYQQSTSSDQVSLSELKQQSLAFGATYQKRWNKKFQTTAQIYYSSYDLNGDDLDVQNNQALEQENQVQDLGLRLQLTRAVDKHLQLFAGYQFNEVGVTNSERVSSPNFESLSKHFNRSHAIFGEAEFTSKHKKTYVRIGLRTNYIEQFSLFFTEPRISFSQELNKDFRLEILGEFKSQSISQVIDLQQDFLGIEKRRWLLSNGENIPLIESQQVSAGLHFNKKQWLVSLEPFYKKVENITARSQGFQNQFQFENAIGNYTISGIDILINKRFKKFSTWMSYSFHKNQYDFEDLNEGVSFPNNKDIRHAISFATTYNFNNLKLALGINWHTGKPNTIPTNENPTSTNPINYEAPNSSRLPDYLRTDLSANYNFKLNPKTDAVIGLSIWNLLDRENIINNYFIRNTSNTIQSIDNKSLGITPNINFRLRF